MAQGYANDNEIDRGELGGARLIAAAILASCKPAQRRKLLAGAMAQLDRVPMHQRADHGYEQAVGVLSAGLLRL